VTARADGPSRRLYGAAVLGNCCTHGAGAARTLAAHPRVQLLGGCEADHRRGPELAAELPTGLSASPEAILGDPAVDIVAITADPCDKADLAEAAVDAGKALFINKPLSHSPSAARRIEAAVQRGSQPAVFDAPMVKFHAALERVRQRVHHGDGGRVVSYYHAFGMTFETDFDIASTWPERFDPASKSGGGEMTNMGCYAIDYALHLLGVPRRVQAKWQRFWEPYRHAEVENFGQILLDYGDFWAVLAVGKQAVSPRRGPRNALHIELESANLFVDPGAGVVVENGHRLPFEDFGVTPSPPAALDELIAALDGGPPPASDIATAALGVEVLCAAYRSICDGGVPVELPLEPPRNPLFEGARRDPCRCSVTSAMPRARSSTTPCTKAAAKVSSSSATA
jgi:predicted dehydrogenase